MPGTVHASFEVRGFDLQVRCLDLQARSFGLQYLAESTVISSDYSLVSGRVMIGNWWLSKKSDSLYTHSEPTLTSRGSISTGR